MTRADEYRKALDEIVPLTGMTFIFVRDADRQFGQTLARNFEIICRALRIAEMLEGEPSEEMRQAASEFVQKIFDNDYLYRAVQQDITAAIFKVMSAELIKQAEEGE